MKSKKNIKAIVSDLVALLAQSQFPSVWQTSSTLAKRLEKERRLFRGQKMQRSQKLGRRRLAESRDS
jgi:hypothetical protein